MIETTVCEIVRFYLREINFSDISSGDSLSSAFDPAEFPSLGSRDNSSAPNPALARSNYGKLCKLRTE